ncbi:hypothetical protein HPB48_013589 [Haemaphysalis longicornis]|uniref:CCHC-type domain-containing protein n=1 Tax=Haemaphysalis longicornis TaxID=44386 RepID=A0A9J6GVV0_HAELO|nr:hypothetical protein HPB48_013589 [Haemaphysalis longicornis]
MKDWLKPREVALAQKLEDGRPRHRAANQRNSEVNGVPRTDRNRELADKNTKAEHRPPPKCCCYGCSCTGHLQYNCPQDKKGQLAPGGTTRSPLANLSCLVNCNCK